jgi:hypothetical protein
VRAATDLNFLFHLLLEACPDDLALTGLESISSGWDRPDIVRHREKNELLVDEVGIWDLINVMVEVCPRLEKMSDPRSNSR